MKRYVFAIVAIFAFVSLTACAAKGVRNQARVGALSVGEAVLALDAAEQQLVVAAVPGYDVEAQKRVAVGVLKVLYASRAYERAAASWPSGGPMPQQLTEARFALTRALDDLMAISPAIDAVRAPLFRAINVIRAALTTDTASRAMPPSVQAQALPPQVVSLFALANLLIGLVGSGRTTVTKIKELLQKEGATDEELAALDVRLSEAIAAREAKAADETAG